MSSLRSLWARHKRKIFVSLGILGSGYALYKLYDAHRAQVLELEDQSEKAHKLDELIKAQLQAHFESIQRISDTATLPHAMNNLRFRISEELDLSPLTRKLMQGKGQQSNSLTPKEKLELWQKLKILSFTKTAASLWSVTILCLYVRVQVNILGRHLYLEIARGSGSTQALDESDSFSTHGQQDFLATADYLSTFGISRLLNNMQNTVEEVLKEKQLNEPFSMDQLRETITQILDLFMSVGEPNNWISYFVPENALSYRQLMAMSTNGFDDTSMLMDISKLEQLMSETCAVLSSPDFKNIVEMSLKLVVDVLVEDIGIQLGGGVSSSPSSVVPLARLLPRVTQLGPPLLEDPVSNKFIHIIRSLPDVELFFTLLYANMPLDF